MESKESKIARPGDKKTLLVSSSSLLSVIVLLYLIIGFQYAALTPRWQVPDEPAHYNYIRYIVENKSLPTLDPGEYQQGYLGELTSKKFPPELSIDSLQYESWQPPLYYLLAAPIYLIFNGALLPLRLFSLLLGGGVIVFTFLAVREAMGTSTLSLSKGVPFVAAGFVAFIPQHIAMMAGINNDSLSELLIAIGLWFILKINNSSTPSGAEQSEAQSKGALGKTGNAPFDYAPSALRSGHLLWTMSVIIGLAFLTKSHAYLLAPVAALMLLLRWRKLLNHLTTQPPNYRTLLTQFTLLFLPALLLGSLFWGRNLATYGWPDFMASIRHDQVVADQPRTQDWVAQFGVPEVLRRFFQTTFQSFWGQFGWMGVLMPERVYGGLLGLMTFLILGFAFGFWTLRVRRIENFAALRIQFSNSLILIFSFSLTLGLYLFYNLTYVQHQGRYLFPALVPLSAAVALSLGQWSTLADKLFKRKVGWLIPLAILAALAGLSLFALYRFIIPALA